MLRRTATAAVLAGLALLTACSSASSGGGPDAAEEVLPTAAPSAVPGKVPEGFAPLSVDFLDESTGWSLGLPECSSPQCTTVVGTTDGGRSWSTLAPPPTDTEDSPDSVTDLRFGSARDGFAYGRGLFATHDGSRTWAKVDVPGEVPALAVDGERVWAVVVQGCTEEGCAGPAGLWTGATTGGPLRPVARTPLLGVGLDQVVLGDGAVFVASGSDEGVPYLLAGAGGGAFTRRALPCATGAVPVVDALDARTLVLVCSKESDTGTVRKAFRSADAGATWRPLGDPPQESGTVVGVTSKAVFVTDTTSGISVTTDDRTWRKSWAAGEEGALYVSFLDDAFGFALAGVAGQGDGQHLLLTRDGGAHWERAF
jgi:photosystem II stability/assembly factor-like uncharacterized protein